MCSCIGVVAMTEPAASDAYSRMLHEALLHLAERLENPKREAVGVPDFPKTTSRKQGLCLLKLLKEGGSHDELSSCPELQALVRRGLSKAQ